MTLTEFLLARIAEDEGDARFVRENYGATHAAKPDRVLAEVEAKRRIVRERNDEGDLQIVLQHLAAVYSDHPDYRESWRA